METKRPISEAAQGCRDALVRCLESEALMGEEWAENRLADFNLWDYSIGASAIDSRLSLDQQLAKDPGTHKIVANVLELLRLSVDDCIQTSLAHLSIYLDEEANARASISTRFRSRGSFERTK